MRFLNSVLSALAMLEMAHVTSGFQFSSLMPSTMGLGLSSRSPMNARSIMTPKSSATISTATPTATSKTPLPTSPAQIQFSTQLAMSSSSSSSSSSLEDSKCPVTQFSNGVQRNLSRLDNRLLARIIRIANHAPALLSLSYFGLISMASMMASGPMAHVAATATATATTTGAKIKGAKLLVAQATTPTIASVLTKTVGQTTNAAFAAMFPTFVTPAPFVFLVWPTIAVLQLLSVIISAIYPSSEEILTQTDLSALTLANLCSTAWLLTSSNAMPNALPIGSTLILPLVPIFSAYPLRNKPTYILWAYQLFSSFTTLASFLAFAVELQHGGRIPFIGTVGPEVAASVFLMLYSAAALGVKQKSGVKRLVNFGALSGILVRRVKDAIAMVGVGASAVGAGAAAVGAGAAAATVGGGGWVSALGSLALSVSFLGTVGCWFWSFKELFSSSA